MQSDTVFLFVVLVSAVIVVTVFFISLRKEKQKVEQKQTKNNTPQRKQVAKKINGIIGETAQLTEKIDARTRRIDDRGSISITDDKYQLVFTTKDNRKLYFSATKQALKAMPFNERGLLTYKGKTFVKFKYSGGVIENK